MAAADHFSMQPCGLGMGPGNKLLLYCAKGIQLLRRVVVMIAQSSVSKESSCCEHSCLDSGFQRQTENTDDREMGVGPCSPIGSEDFQAKDIVFMFLEARKQREVSVIRYQCQAG